MSGQGAHRGPWPALQADEIRRVQAMVAAGVSPTEIAREFRVSRRSVYRYRDRSERRGGGFEEGSAAWVAACMEPEEWATWQALNPRSLAMTEQAARPCADCPLGFAVSMRTIGRCNGTPAGAPEEEEEDEMEITRARAKPVAVRVTVPCGRCTHREVCGIRPSIESLDTEGTEVTLPELNAALTPSLAVSIDCAFFTLDKSVGKDASEPRKTHDWSPEQRAAARARLAARRAAEAERKAAQA